MYTQCNTIILDTLGLKLKVYAFSYRLLLSVPDLVFQVYPQPTTKESV